MANHIKYPVVGGKKQCGTCREWKPLSEFHRCRNHYASACKTCRNLYHAKYRARPNNKERMKIYAAEYMKVASHRKAALRNLKKYRQKPQYKQKRNDWRKAWTANEKGKAIAYKGGACVCCGYSFCPAALDFHHRNPSQKDGYGTGALRAHWTFEKNRVELDKCVLVCVRCHREIHAGVRKL